MASVHEKEKLDSKTYTKDVFETLFFGYRPYLNRILMIVVVGFVGRAMLLGNANLIGAWIDGKVPLDIHQFITLLLVMALVGFVCTITFRITFSRLSAQAVSQIYDETTLRTSRFPMSFFDNNPAGRVITRFSSDYGNVFRLFGGPLAEFLSIIMDLSMMIVLITIASPLFLIFIALVGVLNYLVWRANRNRLRLLRRELSASRSPSIAHFAETTQGASTIRSFRREPSFRSRFKRLDEFFLDKKTNTIRGLIFFSFQMNSLSAVLLLITGLSSVALVQAGFMTVGSVGVAFTFIAMSSTTVQMFFDWLSQLEDAMIGVERLDQYLRAPIEDGNALPQRAQFATGHLAYSPEQEAVLMKTSVTSEKAASVEVKDMWFRYAPELPWVLKNINFTIAPGECIGVVGRTGSGKSSLIQTLFHLYPVQTGDIRIAGLKADIKRSGGPGTIDLNIYRRSLAFIAQDPVLFQGRLRESLDIEGLHSDEEIYAALERVSLKEWVENHPLGLDLKIEERGKNLSLGERQLLCMARCLLQNAPVVIMDEATSAIDPQSEEILVRATEEFFKGRTQILIAHRLSTLSKCDRILWLDDGAVRMIGPTAEVLKEFTKLSHPDLIPKA